MCHVLFTLQGQIVNPCKLPWKLIFTLPSPKQKQWEIRSKLTFPLGYLSYSVFYALILFATEKSQNIHLRKSNPCSIYSWHVEIWGDLALKPEISPIKKESMKIILYVCLQGCLNVLFKSLTGNERIVYPLLEETASESIQLSALSVWF